MLPIKMILRDRADPRNHEIITELLKERKKKTVSGGNIWVVG